MMEGYIKGTGVYGFRNKKNNKWYVGSTTGYFSKRRNEHLLALENCKHHSKKFQRSWTKHGRKSFEYVVLEHVPRPDNISDDEYKYIILPREDYWIDKYDSYNNGYNVVSKAGNTLGYKHSEEAKAKLRYARTGSKQTTETILKKIDAMTGKKASEETRKLLSESIKKSWDGRRDNPTKPEHVAKRQKGREEVRISRFLIVYCMLNHLHKSNQVVFEDMLSYVEECNLGILKHQRAGNARRQKGYRAEGKQPWSERKKRIAAKQASQPQQ